ncbi:hypothetical protein GUJ93_ZPchr0002g25767 [Zizania palustris]|uniref:Uncharacterized protein n=1 Tax=Zizania palustris TaxID=103762 RepID=A0A8J5RIH7_ZIZPA|nr:hypothetical protein GUJ93_ZPchr0002g25767 [Zizania palustris]
MIGFGPQSPRITLDCPRFHSLGLGSGIHPDGGSVWLGGTLARQGYDGDNIIRIQGTDRTTSSSVGSCPWHGLESGSARAKGWRGSRLSSGWGWPWWRRGLLVISLDDLAGEFFHAGWNPRTMTVKQA